MRIAVRSATLVMATLLAGCAQPGWRQQLQSEDPLRRIDGAVTAGRAKALAAAPLLVDRLEDDDEAVRMYAILALQRIEGTNLGYKYWADPVDRAHMAQRWREYLKDRHAHAAAAVFASRQQTAPTADAPSSQPHSTGGPR